MERSALLDTEFEERRRAGVALLHARDGEIAVRDPEQAQLLLSYIVWPEGVPKYIFRARLESEPRSGRQCAGTTRRGSACQRTALAGAEYCWHHRHCFTSEDALDWARTVVKPPNVITLDEAPPVRLVDLL